MSATSLPSHCEELLARMVAHNTINPEFGGPPDGAARLAAELASLAAAWGLGVRHSPVGDDPRANLILTCKADPAAEWLWFESHLDTVAVGGMTVPPFELTLQADRLHGRGACDTKGSGAAMLWALQQYAADARAGRIPAPRNIALAFVVDEEAGMTGAQDLACHAFASPAGVRGIVVGEPTLLRPVVAHNGAMRWRSITRGVAAHSADPSRGRSAISAMLRVVDALETRFIPTAHQHNRLTGRAAASINVIRGGQQVNIIPDYCEIECDRRLVPGETAEEIRAARAAALSGLDVEHDRESFMPPLAESFGRPLLDWAEPAFAVTGLDATAAGAPYVTDASHYAAVGIPTFVLGPGSIAQAHTKDEWLARDQLAAATHLYGALMRR